MAGSWRHCKSNVQNEGPIYDKGQLPSRIPSETPAERYEVSSRPWRRELSRDASGSCC